MSDNYFKRKDSVSRAEEATGLSPAFAGTKLAASAAFTAAASNSANPQDTATRAATHTPSAPISISNTTFPCSPR